MPATIKILPKENGREMTSLSDILVSLGYLKREVAEKIKLAEITTGTPEEETLKKEGGVSEEALTRAKAQLLNVPFIDITSEPVSPEALSLLPQESAERLRVFPLSLDKVGKTLSLAMANPLDLTAIEFVEQKTNLRVKPYAAIPSMVDEYLATKYIGSLSREVSEALKEVTPEADRQKTLDIALTGSIREEKVSEIVTHVLDFAVRARASDVHIEPQESSTRVRYRIDGILQEKLSIPRPLHESLISRIKILSGMKIDEKRIPQDGRFNFRGAGEDIDLRISTLPTSWGEKVVMRLLKKTGGIPDLGELGLRGIALKNLGDAILRPHGIILLCGPTGSGKTTTLYSIISRINSPKVNIVTLEDPIEYKIPGVNQVQVNPSAGLTFASGLRAFLRQDPNIILVGEIRDRETADLAVQASLTGHLVFSTLHTNDAATALPRLLDIGAEPFLIASSMTAIVAQRVLRKIDEEAKEEFDPDPKVAGEIKKVLGNFIPQDKALKLYKGKPTEKNNNSGFLGRIGIFEVLPVSERISKLILERQPASAIEAIAREEGMITLKQDGYLKALEGITSLEEVLRVAEE